MRRRSPSTSSFRYKPLPSSPCAWGWDTGPNRIRQALGFNSKMPADFQGTFEIDGWKVVVKRGQPAKPTVSGRLKKSATHRIFVEVDGQQVPAGRVRQALCKEVVARAQNTIAKRRDPKTGRLISRWASGQR